MMPVSRSRYLRRILTAGAIAALGELALAGGALAGESAQPYCWGPENSPYDCPDYSAMDPYTYGSYYNYYAYPYAYAYPYLYPYGYGPSYPYPRRRW
jgi:hypothetical protein